MIKKLWVKWNDMDVECVCNENNRKCADVPGEKPKCKEYVVKFIEINRPVFVKDPDDQIKDFGTAIKKFDRDLKKKIKELNRFKVR